MLKYDVTFIVLLNCLFFQIEHEKTGSTFRMFRSNTLRKHMISEHIFSSVPAGVTKQSGSECVVCPDTMQAKYSDFVDENEIMTFTLSNKSLSKLYKRLPEEHSP